MTPPSTLYRPPLASLGGNVSPQQAQASAQVTAYHAGDAFRTRENSAQRSGLTDMHIDEGEIRNSFSDVNYLINGSQKLLSFLELDSPSINQFVLRRRR
jgi:hypothetical protein